MSSEPLTLRFDPQTVDHLGAKMYSHLPNALAELVANAYDADATKVTIKIERDSISITDDGHGMSREDLADKYLRIGRNRRSTERTASTESGNRLVSGKKGLGKLALFGIGRRIDLSTTRAGSTVRTRVALSYDEMMHSDGDYRPGETTASADQSAHGTVVRLSELKRATPVDAAEVAASLSRLFNYVDSSFEVDVVGADGVRHPVTRESRLASMQVEFEWDFPRDFDSDDQFAKERGISGRIVSSAKPLRQGMRGITIYVNGRLANEPEYYGASESSYAFSYLSGYLTVDFLDSIEPDVIATDRRAIDWDTEVTLELRDQLQRLIRRVGQEWRTRRSRKRQEEAEEALGGTTEDWVNTIRAEEQAPVRSLIDAIGSDEIDMAPDVQGRLLQLVQSVAPPHAEYVWRHLHPEIRDATEKHYIDGDYYTAIQEAIKRFVNETRLRSGIDESQAQALVSKAFGENGRLRVFQKYMSESNFDPQTGTNVERGQQHVAMGIVSGFRNPLAHEEIRNLHASGAFTNDDCLDALSIVSHLMRRLSDAVDA